MANTEFLNNWEKELNSKNLKSLIAYANYIINRYYLCRRVDKVIPEGKTPEDFVHETIMKIIDGQRNWSQKDNYDFIPTLKGHIRSVISSTFRRKEHNAISKVLIDSDYNDLTENEKDESISNITLIELKEIIEEIFILVNDDEELKDLLYCFEGGLISRKEIAEYLEINPNEVTNRLKRLHRKLKSFNIQEL
jgi:RNA polymerase sigma factor (sigma-70 family)